MKDEESICLDPPPPPLADFYRDALAAMPSPADVWLAAAAHPTALSDYAAAQFQGLYEECRGLLEALLGAKERIQRDLYDVE